jgi:hypothetical protein
MADAGGATRFISSFSGFRGACAGKGFSAAGRSSANPATASKAEKKKRGEGTRRSTISIVSGEDRSDPACVRLSHGKAYTRLGAAEQGRVTGDICTASKTQGHERGPVPNENVECLLLQKLIAKVRDLRPIFATEFL